MTDFLQMSYATKRRNPRVDATPSVLFCLRDATDLEFIQLIQEPRLEWGKLHNLGPYTMQQSICLHFASRVPMTELDGSRNAEG